MVGLRKKKGVRAELSSMLERALTSSDDNVTPATKGKPALAGARAVATGAALYATGRALVSGRNKLNQPAPEEEEEEGAGREEDDEPGLEADEDPEPEHEEIEDDERDGRPRLRTRVRWLERD